MSRETSTWLNTMTLIGFTSKRGNAWHYRAEDQGVEPNHYDLAIPVEDVRRRLFGWKPVEGSVTASVISEDGVDLYEDDSRKAIIRPRGAFGPTDKGAILGLFKDGYTIHDFDAWLITNVENLLDGYLSVGSAGLLKGGAVAWVQIEAPETVSTPEGVDFRPFITAATSLDGSLSSTYLSGAQLVVCDNTLSAALGEAGSLRIKVKHSRKSLGKIGDVRAALGIVHQVEEDFAAQVASLCATPVSDKEWAAFLDAHTPLDVKGVAKTGRGLTVATQERDALSTLWNNDNRVSPWKGTAFGVVQAVNTYTHHVGTVRNVSRVDRNALRVVTGGVDALDNATLNELVSVLAR